MMKSEMKYVMKSHTNRFSIAKAQMKHGKICNTWQVIARPLLSFFLAYPPRIGGKPYAFGVWHGELLIIVAGVQPIMSTPLTHTHIHLKIITIESIRFWSNLTDSIKLYNIIAIDSNRSTNFHSGRSQNSAFDR